MSELFGAKEVKEFWEIYAQLDMLNEGSTQMQKDNKYLIVTTKLTSSDMKEAANTIIINKSKRSGKYYGGKAGTGGGTYTVPDWYDETEELKFSEFKGKAWCDVPDWFVEEQAEKPPAINPSTNKPYTNKAELEMHRRMNLGIWKEAGSQDAGGDDSDLPF